MEWSFNPLVAIGVLLAIMFFGYFFGLYEGRNQGYKNRKKEEIDEKKHQSVSVEPTNLPRSDETPVLNVSMNLTGELLLKLDGNPTDTNALDSEDRKRLIAILTAMRPWLEVPKTAAASSAAPKPVSSPQGVSSPRPQAAPVPTLAISAPDPKPALSSPNDDDDEVAVPQSIVAQINSVLKARLVGTPLADKGIRLQESRDGGVLVWIGMEKFEGVDEVPDENIKAALKSAISEWENKFTPGL